MGWVIALALGAVTEKREGWLQGACPWANPGARG